MGTQSKATAVPLPFTTAALGLLLSYLFPSHVNPLWATLIGFAAGIMVLYAAGGPSHGRDSLTEKDVALLRSYLLPTGPSEASPSGSSTQKLTELQLLVKLQDEIRDLQINQGRLMIAQRMTAKTGQRE